MKSMTGFGRAKYEESLREYSVEIKSVNHKYNDVSVKLPRSLSYLEEKVKKEISNCISRGKVDVFISFTNNSDKGKNVRINTEIAKLYIDQLQNLCDETNIQNNINIMDISKMPDVLTIENVEDEELIWNELSKALNIALNSFVEMRQAEGQKIGEDLKRRIEKISIKIDEICTYSTRLVEEYVVKLENRIKEILKTDIDEARLAQEVVIYADKCSVEEEITRLKSHINQFLKLLDTSEAIGKKLDFLLQEMNRETNTIGSKANCLEITNLVVDVKTELENIREQVQNIE